MPIRKTIKNIEKFVIYRILHANESPHRLALSIGLGLFIAWTPTIGIQMILAFALAALFRANTRIGPALVWVSNPLTLVPIYLPNYWLGQKLLQMFSDRPAPDYAQIKEAIASFSSPGNVLVNFFNPSFWHDMFHLLFNISVELWLGSIIIGLLVGGISYLVSYKMIYWYRTNNPNARLLLELVRRRKEKD
ncbi:MAG: DUF2062 domain-containing protein [Sedimentisphaerales bacterium]|nr:DUF2062 domain-containing protein [Sedimentisphaerales bacterium]